VITKRIFSIAGPHDGIWREVERQAAFFVSEARDVFKASCLCESGVAAAPCHRMTLRVLRCCKKWVVCWLSGFEDVVRYLEDCQRIGMHRVREAGGVFKGALPVRKWCRRYRSAFAFHDPRRARVAG